MINRKVRAKNPQLLIAEDRSLQAIKNSAQLTHLVFDEKEPKQERQELLKD